MQSFICLEAIAAPLPIANVDTDKILAAQFLKTITRRGLGTKLFWSLRQQSCFVLNQPPWDNAGILIALENFGCGSSREHAPWALLDFGIRCVMAPRIADIFYNNCLKNGILPIQLPDAAIDRLMTLASDPDTARMTIDLPSQTIATLDGNFEHFEINGQSKADLLGGVDEIGRTLGEQRTIARFEERHRRNLPWIRPININI